MNKSLIVFCPWGDAQNANTLSGIPYYLIEFLKKKYELIIIDTSNIDSFKLNVATRLNVKILKFASTLITRLLKQKRFQFGGVQMSFNYLLGKRLEKISATYSNLPILTFGLGATRFYKGSSPVFNYTDGFFTYKIDYYINRDKLTKWEKYNILRTDINGINHSAVVLCTSEIIMRNVLTFINDKKGHTNTKIANTGIGSNLPEVFVYNQRVKNDCLNICFIYSDFYRKGGDVVLNIAELSEDKNFKFHFIGKVPVIEKTKYKNVTFHGFINKKTNLDNYLNVMKSCSINIMPTRGDLTPHVICECNSYGIPTIANNVGGIKDLIGEGGILIQGLNAQEYISAINMVASNLDNRSKICFEKYLYEQKWSTVVEKISKEIEQMGAA